MRGPGDGEGFPVTSHRSVAEWDEVFRDAVIGTGILDRLPHRSHVCTITGDSYRLREKRRDGALKLTAPKPVAPENYLHPPIRAPIRTGSTLSTVPPPNDKSYRGRHHPASVEPSALSSRTTVSSTSRRRSLFSWRRSRFIGCLFRPSSVTST